MENNLIAIGHIETPYTNLEECPRNISSNGPTCRLLVKDEFHEGLAGLESNQEILILYWLEDVNRNIMVQGTNPIRGTFSLRSPHRPNPIGAAVLPIVSITGGIITVEGLDCLDNTKLLDIKPAIRRETSEG